jgi:hypothetical protein
MKNLLPALALCLLITSPAVAQFPYSGETFTDTYQPLTDYDFLEVEAGWDDPELYVPFGFDFMFDDVVTDFAFLGDVGEALFLLQDYDEVTNMIIPISLDLMDVAGYAPELVSTFRVVTEGEAPSRVFKMEWNEVGFYNLLESTGDYEQRMNFQVWLYEQQGNIEFRFGTNTVTDILAIIDEGFLVSALVWDVGEMTGGSMVYAVQGPTADPTYTTVTDMDNWIPSNLNGIPAEGQGYRFTSTTGNGDERAVSEETFSCYPNPASDQLTVVGGSTELEISLCDLAGRVIERFTLPAHGRQTVNVGGLTAGAYALTTSAGANQVLLVR